MFKTTLEFPISCLCLNKDGAQMVAAGRSVFKVFNIEEGAFTEQLNLRVGTRPNPINCIMSVAWNPSEAHIIASAATDGAVVTWNLNKSSANKQEQVYREHARAVNKVAFHKNEAQTLLSGSVDGYMKIFDLRARGVSEEFFGRSSSVRDVQFNPHQYFQFAAAFENGNVQIWDMRMNNRYERMFTAHGDPVLSLDFHPEEKNWIGTSGRDKQIKVWDMTNPVQTVNSHTVQNINGVLQIKWRPQRKYHIASCAMLLDFSINVWDIRRPYIPFAAFNQHKDRVTGIQWKANDPKVFYSSSIDCSMYAHHFKEAERPVKKANPVCVNVDTHGRILYASSSKNTTPPASDKNLLSQFPSRFRKAPDKAEEFVQATSVLYEITLSDELKEDLDMTWFVESAKQYLLTGKSIDELCEHNAHVALTLNRPQVAQSWSLLRLLYSCGASTPTVQQQSRPSLLKAADVIARKSDVINGGEVPLSDREDVRPAESGDTGDTSTLSENSSSESEDERDLTLTNIARGHGNTSLTDLLFAPDTDLDQSGYDFDEMSVTERGLPDSVEGSLPEEALQPRVDMGQISGESPQQSRHSLHPHHSTADTHISINLPTADQFRQKLLTMPQFSDMMVRWKFKQHVLDMLQHYADKGDVQMAVSVMIVLGDHIRRDVDELVQEQWYMGYIDLLTRFQMYSTANRIMKQSKHANVESLNQTSTTIHTYCAQCNKQLMRAGWLCERCNNHRHICSLCHLPVKGLYVWCQGCSHGGHISHMREWYETRRYCPAGCGHLCQYGDSTAWKHR